MNNATDQGLISYSESFKRQVVSELEQGKYKTPIMLHEPRYFYLDAQPQLAKRIDKNLAISLLLVFGKLG